MGLAVAKSRGKSPPIARPYLGTLKVVRADFVWGALLGLGWTLLGVLDASPVMASDSPLGAIQSTIFLGLVYVSVGLIYTGWLLVPLAGACGYLLSKHHRRCNTPVM
jgi:hypothetical protein